LWDPELRGGLRHLSKSERFLRCREKTCCSYGAVFLTGDDLVRLARTIDAPPWTFTVAVATETPAGDAFALDATATRYRAALARLPEQASRERCIFLLRLDGGAARCGLGDARPMPCHTFASELHDDTVRVSAAGCTCRIWSLDDVDVEAERALLLVERDAARNYALLVAGWNAFVATRPPTDPYAYADFCRFIMAQYEVS
jgi:Fe-S-cluster containining protein